MTYATPALVPLEAPSAAASCCIRATGGASQGSCNFSPFTGLAGRVVADVSEAASNPYSLLP